MKVVLSRKGFDSSYGGMANPILPDGTLLPLPIPAKGESLKYIDLHYKSHSYYDIITQLKPTTKIKENWTCHLDPDLIKEVVNREMPWKPLFGQCNQAQSHLANNGVGVGDIFLFWGWFRQTELYSGKLRYAAKAPDIHLIWGYMKVLKVSKGVQIPKEYSYHPHGLLSLESNAIYESKLADAGVLPYSQKRVLTKAGFSRSKWDLPEFFKDIEMTYHTKASFKSDYFQSAKKGQEFVLEETPIVEQWCKELIFP